MEKPIARQSRETFEQWVHAALNHLYDSAYLEKLPLVDWLVPQDERTSSRSQDLRRVIIASIQAKKPPRTAPAQSHDWRGYQILEQRFISGLSPAEVISRLNISRSLFFIEQARILKNLIDDLWNRRVRMEAPLQLAATEEKAAPNTRGLNSEANRLLENANFQPINIQTLLSSIRPIISPLAKTHAVMFECEETSLDLVRHGDRVLLRQVIISLSSEMINRVPGGKLLIRRIDTCIEYGVQIKAESGGSEPFVPNQEDRQGLSLETCQQLLRAMNGDLHTSVWDGQANGERVYEARLVWQSEALPKNLLLIDDQPALADLFERYLTGGKWHLLHAATTEQARQILNGVQPSVILLDVILPHEDGWEFLVELKNDEALQHIPVIVCSAINEPGLVQSLGADGYLPKPVSQVELLKMLRQWL